MKSEPDYSAANQVLNNGVVSGRIGLIAETKESVNNYGHSVISLANGSIPLSNKVIAPVRFHAIIQSISQGGKIL